MWGHIMVRMSTGSKKIEEAQSTGKGIKMKSVDEEYRS